MAASANSWWSKDTVAVVTGANRGIGLEIVRQLAASGLTVVLSARDPERGNAAVDALKAEGHKSVFFYPLDLGSAESVEKLAAWLKAEFGGIDILVSNAAVRYFDVDYENAKATIDINYYGTVRVIEELLPLMRASPAGARIVNVTSRRGLYEGLKSESVKELLRAEDKYSKELASSLASKYLDDVKAGRNVEEGWMKGTHAMYAESKIFMNTYSVALAKSLAESQPAEHRIFVTSYCPGLVDTGLLDEYVARGVVLPAGVFPKTIPQGAENGVWLALLPKEEILEKNGKFFGERTEYPLSLVMKA